MAENGKYTTDHGGIVERVDGKLVFTKKPDSEHVDIGDPLPEDWLLIPANKETLTADERSIPDNKPLTEDEIIFIDE